MGLESVTNRTAGSEPPVERSPLVNRIEELSWLEGHLRSAVTGRPRVLVLLGEAGIGKSRLVREIAAVARDSGVAVCIGRGHETLTLPYMPIVEALRARLDQLTPPERQMLDPSLIGNDAPIEQLLSPSTQGEPNSALTSNSDQAGGAQQLALYIGVSRTLFALAQSRPTLLILEDLHWADGPSLDLLGHIVFTLGDRDPRLRVPLMIVCVSRPPQAADRVGRLFARFAREPLCAARELSGLSAEHTRELIDRIAPQRLSHRALDAVVHATGGNPLFVQELLLALRRRSASPHGSHEDWPETGDALPESLLLAVAARIEALEPSCVSALTQAAVLGDRFRVDLLATLMAQPVATVIDWIEPALRERVLYASGERLSFTHPLIRHVLYQRASAPRRQLMHTRVADALLSAPEQAQSSVEIAHHLLAAGAQVAPALLVTQAVKAGQQSLRQCAWAEAARYFIAAAEAVHLVAPDDHVRHAELEQAAGTALRNDGDRRGSVERLDRAIDAYRRAGDTISAARVLHLRTRANIAQLEYGAPVAAHPLEEVAAFVEREQPVLAGLLKEALCEVYWIALQLDRAEELGQESLALGRLHDDDLLIHHASLGLGLVRFQQLRFEDALDCYRESRTAAARAGDLWLEAGVTQRVPPVLLIAGQLEAAERATREALQLASELHNGADASLAFAYLSNLAIARGELTEGENLAHSAIATMQRSEYPWGGLTALPALACARCLRGSFGEALDALAWLRTPGKVHTTPGPQIELLAAIYRDLVEARAGKASDEPLRDRVQFYAAVGTTRAVDAGTLAPICAVLELALGLDDRSAVEALERMLRSAYERGAVVTLGWVFLVPHMLANAAVALGREEVAIGLFEHALALARRERMGPELARAQLDYARLLAARADHEAACEHAAAAQQRFAQLGAARERDAASAVLRELGVEVGDHVSQPATDPVPLSGREADLLRRVARGQSDATIAEDRISSPGIIAADVHSLLAKIGVDRRSAAVAYAYEQGLLTRDAISGQVPLAILVTDIGGFTEMVQRLGDAAAQTVIQTHNQILRGCLRRHRGVEVTHTGDGMIASFVTTRAALHCAVDIQREIDAYSARCPEAPLAVRIGISAGSPRIEEDRLFGSAINAAVRICGHAGVGQVLVSDAVARGGTDDLRLECLGEVALKGFAQTLSLHDVTWRSPQGD